MMSRNTKQVDKEEATKIFQATSNEDLYYKLEIAMKHLDEVDSTKGAVFYFEKSKEIMQYLH